MLNVVRRGFLTLSSEHWDQVVSLILPLMQKFRYKTDLFFNSLIDVTLLGFTFGPAFMAQIKDIPQQYEHLFRFANTLSVEAFEDYLRTEDTYSENTCAVSYYLILERCKKDKSYQKSKLEIQELVKHTVKSEACKLIIPIEFDRKTAQISRYDLISVVKKLQLLLK